MIRRAAWLPAAAWLMVAAGCCAGQVRFVPHTALAGRDTLGAAIESGGSVLTWGDGLWRVPRRGQARLLAKGNFAAGGCAIPGGVILQQGTGLGDLIRLRDPSYLPERIDGSIGLHDCAWTTLDGREGVLVVHRGLQVRFYEPPAWNYREIYSFYTPSAQGGLALTDVNRDGRVDILCGNYWIRQPDSFESGWRLFAINTYSEGKRSAMSRLAITSVAGRLNLVVAQRELNPGRLTWFERPPRVEDLWREQVIDAGLRFPAVLAVADFDGDGSIDIVAGENAGPGSRLLLYRGVEGRPGFASSAIATGNGWIGAGAVDINKDGRVDLVTAGPREVTWWENRRR
jgi:hypothetical protein